MVSDVTLDRTVMGIRKSGVRPHSSVSAPHRGAVTSSVIFF